MFGRLASILMYIRIPLLGGDYVPELMSEYENICHLERPRS